MKSQNAYCFLFLFVLLIAPTNVVLAEYVKGDTLYILARKGLNMRAMPSSTAPLLQELAYGTRVIISSDSIFDEYRVEDIKDFFIKGNWRKVCTETACGYVFDGYLSKFVAPPLKYEKKEWEEYLDAVSYYFKNFFKLKPKIITLKKDKNCKKEIYDRSCIYSWRVNLGDKISYIVDLVEFGTSEKFIFKKIPFKDIYLLSKIWHLRDYDSSSLINDCVRYDKEKNEINFFVCEGGAGCDYTLKNEKGAVILEGGCGC
jgi:hypothetical protein